MSKKVPPRDPVRSYQRKAIASRRVGNQKCAQCGETRPEALIPGTKPTLCAACQRENQAHSKLDAHHPAGKANSTATVRIPVNDHRAVLSPAQYDWPTETLENVDGSPLLIAAAHIRAFIDMLYYMIDKFLVWIPELLELLNSLLTKQRGRKWWRDTELQRFSSRR